MQTIFILAGGVLGAAGVALSAVAAHAGGDTLSTAALFLMVHAPALLVLGLAAGGRVAATGGVLLLAGVALFSGDLVLREFAGTRLFPMAAPTGGTLMIVGWLAVGASALSGRKGRA